MCRNETCAITTNKVKGGDFNVVNLDRESAFQRQRRNAFLGDARARARDHQERVRGIAQWKNEIFGECRIGIFAVLKRFGGISRGKRKKSEKT